MHLICHYTFKNYLFLSKEHTVYISPETLDKKQKQYKGLSTNKENQAIRPIPEPLNKKAIQGNIYHISDVG